MQERVRALARRGLQIACGSALLLLSAQAATTTAVPVGSCLRLNHTAQALTEFNNLGPQVSAADARASFAVLQASEQALQGDRAFAKLPAMGAVQHNWQALDAAFRQLPSGASVGAMHQQLQESKHAYRIALNGLIVSITCQP
ncbi:MAG: hypothetical protein ACO27M_12310 [Vulcanococcus sp.]